MKIEGKIQKAVEKRVKRTEVMSLKQKKNLKDSQKKMRNEEEWRKERGKEKTKKVEVSLLWQKKVFTAPQQIM